MKKLLLLAFMLTACQSTPLEDTPRDVDPIDEEWQDISGSSSCDAPDYTYPQLTYETWNGIEFGLPWCWTANEEGETLRLEHGEGEAWVEFSNPPRTYDGPSEGYMRADEDAYSTFDFGGELLLTTNNPDHSNVQDIIYSITLP